MPTPTIATTSTRAMVEAAQRRGVALDALLDPFDLTLTALSQPQARLDAQTALGVWARAADLCGEPELPTLAALELGWGAYRIIDMLAASAATVGQALEMVSRYFRLVHDTIRLPLESGDGTVLTIHGARPIPSPYIDYTLAACVHRVASPWGAPLPVHLMRRRAPPLDPEPFQHVFAGSVAFHQPRDAVHIPQHVWDAPMPGKDHRLRQQLLHHADRELQSLEADDLLDVQEALLHALPRGRAELAHVARSLGQSKRTVQRRLTQAGTTWSKLLQRTRQDIATELLADPNLTIDEISLMLGYSEASAFHRAFTRWTGRTPGSVR